MILMTIRFICDARNVLFLGPPDIGKSHLSMAPGLAVLQCGYTVFYRNAFDLITDLSGAQRADQRKDLII